jgi:threonine aldolase
VRRVELRSDTFTLPTAAMREAMHQAELGDDVWGEDPTVNRLEAMAAALVGKEAALFVSSGTMGNLVGVAVHTRPGQEVIAEATAHIPTAEAAGAAVVSGVQLARVATSDGILTPAHIRSALRSNDIHEPPTGLVCLENTHTHHGGTVYTPAATRAAAAAAHAAGVPVHLDGARVFNAAVALGCNVRDLTDSVDSVTFCLSKGLAAPAGSLLCGPRAFVEQARRKRKMLGGGMRQVGVLAAAGIVALEQMIPRLADDHAHAHRLAVGLQGLDGIQVDLARVRTNIVMVDCPSPAAAARLLEAVTAQGIQAALSDPDRIRMVTHHGVDAEDIEYTLAAFRKALAPIAA